ncbi:rhomboid family intramembrane serine protease [Algirhabdus cladophorae]|uniref:rhomboid family intramembrane serine protease n=1 Tax=Algirhabdus cladophorae TaxID=3377108 RepID=UPI003B847925
MFGRSLAPALRDHASFAVWSVVALCSAIELALNLSDWGLIGPARLRSLAYDYGGFWPGLLSGWRPNYAGQPYAMFFSYSFLHGGLSHLIVNMITLVSIGHYVEARVGAKGFFSVYAGATLGGAVGYWLLTNEVRPMVGASGALFGLVGAVLAWSYVDRFTLRLGLWPVLRGVLLLVLLNVVLWWAMDGLLAWETHLGGFITGWLMATLVDPRGRPDLYDHDDPDLDVP